MKDKFVQLLTNVNRLGVDDLIEYLEQETDFFTAPASTQYHGAKEGGLLEHSLAVFESLQKIMQTFFGDWDSDTIVITALLHDVCKANFYKTTTRNVKNEATGVWEKVPYIVIDDQLPLGHGEKSVIMIQRFMNLTTEEIMAIRWHMAGFDDTARQWAGGLALSGAMGKYPLITALHMADLAATYFDEA